MSLSKFSKMLKLWQIWRTHKIRVFFFFAPNLAPESVNAATLSCTVRSSRLVTGSDKIKPKIAAMEPALLLLLQRAQRLIAYRMTYVLSSIQNESNWEGHCIYCQPPSHCGPLLVINESQTVLNRRILKGIRFYSRFTLASYTKGMQDVQMEPDLPKPWRTNTCWLGPWPIVFPKCDWVYITCGRGFLYRQCKSVVTSWIKILSPGGIEMRHCRIRRELFATRPWYSCFS